MSFTMSLEWHRECLKNLTNSLISENKKIEDLRKHTVRLEEEIITLTKQIEQAEKEGKTHFDCTKYKVKKSKT